MCRLVNYRPITLKIQDLLVILSHGMDKFIILPAASLWFIPVFALYYLGGKT